MKKFFLYPLFGLFGFILAIVLGLFLILFFKPTFIINPDSLKWVLNKTEIFKEWSWEEAKLSHDWIHWNERIIKGHFKNFCFEFENESAAIGTCLQTISWNFKLEFFKGSGIQSRSIKPIILVSEWSKIQMKDAPKPKEPEEPSPEIWTYWKMLWNPLIPDMDFQFRNNKILVKEKEFKFDVELVKTPKELNIRSMDFLVWANPSRLKLIAPKKFEIPYDLKYAPRLHLYNTELVADMKSTGIPLHLSGALETIHFEFDSFLDLPLTDTFESLSFKKKFLLSTKGKIEIKNVKENIGRFAPKPFNVMPAPFNDMNGDIELQIKTEESEKDEYVLMKVQTDIDLKSQDQILLMTLGTDVMLDLLLQRPDSILLGIDFKKVKIKLPRISKKSLPPQFLPDSRIKKNAQDMKKKPKVSETEMEFKIEAIGDKALGLSSNLLDEVLRLNLDLFVKNGTVDDGYVKVLPLKTTVFKRPIRIPSMVVKFNHPTDPVLDGVVKFMLPQYEITMDLEGPVFEPRFALTSEPPLSRNDIYSVLLFGRTLADLDPDDKRAATQTNQLLANGILSLSVLYFLSGSPVEYVGYDPDSKNATAQIGLGSKSSLRVGGDSDGLNSTGIRHSIGKGWYIDTSAQSGQNSNYTNKATDYGVMLERIIAY